ncbi:CBASS cGAMP-activated phospholipase [Aquisphaera insulae]|uniref:CBASS cGAMP-activated phospholipase n=1 Tax=Aquisphaera insulae TaxID=2712864 RepID=UPI0013ED1A1E|nr:CBASS cGAMP-activated phospholipase [Aquisphaera insulae]
MEGPESEPPVQPEAGTKPFRILSLDGGGIRGAFTAAFLARLEKTLEHPLTEYFDLIAGTSTGGIIAVALALGEPCHRIRDFYQEYGPQIFSRRDALPIPGWVLNRLSVVANQYLAPYGLDVDAFRQSKYDGVVLKQALEQVLGTRTLNDAKTRLVIPSVDLVSGKTVVFKTPHQPGFIRDKHLSAVDVVLATTAAPTYFPHAVMKPGTAYTDGGVWANNPSMVAYVEALKIREVCTRPGIDPVFDMQDVQLLSIGTGKPKYSMTPPEVGPGLGWWALRLLDVVFTSQAQGVDNQVRYVLGEQYYRVDFDILDKSWSLDAVNLVSTLVHLGEEKAVENYAVLKRDLLNSTSNRPYHPFA